MQWKPNTTVAAIAERAGRFLLVEENINGKAVFNQPAGHLEQGETLIAAVKREVMEETAFEFEPESLVGVYLYPNPHDRAVSYLRFCFYGHCGRHHAERPLDRGILRAVWLGAAEIKQRPLRSVMVTRCLEDHLKGQHYPLALIQHHC